MTGCRDCAWHEGTRMVEARRKARQWISEAATARREQAAFLRKLHDQFIALDKVRP